MSPEQKQQMLQLYSDAGEPISFINAQLALAIKACDAGDASTARDHVMQATLANDKAGEALGKGAKMLISIDADAPAAQPPTTPYPNPVVDPVDEGPVGRGSIPVADIEREDKRFLSMWTSYHPGREWFYDVLSGSNADIRAAINEGAEFAPGFDQNTYSTAHSVAIKTAVSNLHE